MVLKEKDHDNDRFLPLFFEGFRRKKKKVHLLSFLPTNEIQRSHNLD